MCVLMLKMVERPPFFKSPLIKITMANKWIQFLAKFRKQNPSLSMKDAMKKGAVAYKSQKDPAKKARKKGGRKKKT